MTELLSLGLGLYACGEVPWPVAHTHLEVEILGMAICEKEGEYERQSRGRQAGRMGRIGGTVYYSIFITQTEYCGLDLRVMHSKKTRTQYLRGSF